MLRLLIEYREDLSGQRTRVVNWLHALLRALRLGGAKRSLTAAQAAHLMEELEPASAVDAARQRIAAHLLEDLRRLDAQLTANRRDLTSAVAASGTSLTQIRGLGRSWPPPSWRSPSM